MSRKAGSSRKIDNALYLVANKNIRKNNINFFLKFFLLWLSMKSKRK